MYDLKYMKKYKIFLKKMIRPLLIVLGLLFVVYFAVAVHNYRRIQSGELVKFQGHWYTPDQLSQIVPPQYAPLKEPKNTTEEVYTKFREALLSGDIEGALGYIREESREEYREDFNNPEIIKLYMGIPEFDTMQFHDGLENFQEGYSYIDADKTFHVNFKLNQKTALWEIDNI